MGNQESIKELLELSFFIPSYQRGYRWTEHQIEDLLNDIDKFQLKSDKKNWYCLQPLVVKKLLEKDIQEKELNNSKNWFELIDGQQRLTTIYLIGLYINKNKDKQIELTYETRENSSAFLKNLNIDKNDNSNIDYFHISEAYKIINIWMHKQNDSFNKENFTNKFFNFTKVIWYETNEKDSISIFTRINIGKIPLTNGELIKALFLNRSNFQSDNLETIRLKQLEIASEWDRIENTLQNSEFWYFINKDKNNIATRIEFIVSVN